MQDSRTLRMIMVTALVLALAALLTTPAQAMYPTELDSGPAQTPATPPASSDGWFDAVTGLGIAGAILALALGATAMLVFSRRRRGQVALS